MSIYLVTIINRHNGKKTDLIVEAADPELLGDSFRKTTYAALGLEIWEVARIPNWTSIETLTKL